MTNRESQEIADLDVHNYCEKHNNKFAGIYPCKLINVSGEWLNYPNRAKDILDFLPEFTPEAPIDLQQLRSNSNEDIQNQNYAMAFSPTRTRSG